MYLLKNIKCSRCGGEIAVLPYTEDDQFGKSRRVVDCGKCTYCDKVEILPTEDYRDFVRDYCYAR